MKKIIKRIVKILFLIVFVAVIIFVFSYVNPGKVKPLDKARLDVQTVFLKFLGENYVTDFIPYEYGENEAHHLLTYDEVAKYLVQLETGDVFFTASENYLCSELTPGKWKHSVIYIGTRSEFEEIYSPNEEFYQLVNPLYITGEEILILDGSKDGIKIRELSALSNLADYSFMCSCIGYTYGTTVEEKKKFLKYASDQLGKGYDYDINTDDDETYYCSELLYKSFISIEVDVDIRTKMLARVAVSPNDLVEFINQDPRFKEVFFIEKSQDKIIEAEY